ncbi:hypothetical protein BSPWISOXPB_2857 [uncultured Gammaproteobacteria bacterium]|nr:hypothetical protein BSPWISOXPB_2857 [uncultured Gammaproteobacteria bacterium]
MDKNGNYKVVHGLKLDQISKGDLKVLINAHGKSREIETEVLRKLPNISVL